MNQINQINQIINYFKDKNEIIAVYLYGSFVTDKYSKDSDIDIALLTTQYKNKTESYKARIRYQTELSKLLRKDVDIVLLQEANEILAYQILKKGEMILERNRDIHRNFKAIKLIQCIDFKFLENRMQEGLVAAMRKEARGR